MLGPPGAARKENHASKSREASQAGHSEHTLRACASRALLNNLKIYRKAAKGAKGRKGTQRDAKGRKGNRVIDIILLWLCVP